MAFPARSDRPHVLYRFFDREDRLLYVGITKNPGRRLSQHGWDKEWWDDVVKVTLERFPDKETCREAERAAIQAEHPLYNRTLLRLPLEAMLMSSWTSRSAIRTLGGSTHAPRCSLSEARLHLARIGNGYRLLA